MWGEEGEEVGFEAFGDWDFGAIEELEPVAVEGLYVADVYNEGFVHLHECGCREGGVEGFHGGARDDHALSGGVDLDVVLHAFGIEDVG